MAAFSASLIVTKGNCAKGGIGREFMEFIQMGVGYDHYVPIGIWVCIQNHITMGAAMDDQRFFVGFARGVTKNAHGGLVRAGNVGISPGGPEIVHGARVADGRDAVRGYSPAPSAGSSRGFQPGGGAPTYVKVNGQPEAKLEAIRSSLENFTPEVKPGPINSNATAAALYAQMRDALRHGDWAAFGRAFEALGRVLGQSSKP